MTKKIKEPKAPKKIKEAKPVKKGTITFRKKKPTADTELKGFQELPPFVATLPNVDLLPQSLRDAAALRRAVAQMVGVGFLVLGIFIAAFVGQQGLIIAANRNLTQETDTATELTAETNKFLPVRAFYGQITSNSQQILANMSKEVAIETTMRTIQSAGSKNATLGGVDVQIDTSVGGAQNAVAPSSTPTEVFAGCPQVDLFNPHSPAVGCVKVTGSVKSRAALSQWVSDMEAESMFVSPFVSDSTSDDKKINFVASFGVTAKVFSLRYTKDYLKGPVQ